MRSVFISSSLVGLGNWRRAAERAVEATGLRAVRLERLWPARPASQRTAELATRVAAEVSKSDAFIRIVTARKGARIGGSDRTFLDQELEAARAADLPIFFYLHPEAAAFNRLAANEATQVDLAAFSGSATFGTVASPEELLAKACRDLEAWRDGLAPPRRVITLERVSPALVSRLLQRPAELSSCPDRLFEELIAELLRSDGWDVQLVARLNAPGPDIVACSSRLVRGMPIRMLVECKRYRPDRPVDVREIRNLVYWVNEEYRATLGMIATSSTFTSVALAAAEELHHWRVSLRDHSEVLKWLASSSLAVSSPVAERSPIME